MRWLTCILFILIASRAYGGVLSLGYDRTVSDRRLVEIYSAEVKDRLAGINFGAGITVNREHQEEWKISLSNDWANFNYQGGGNLPELIDLRFKYNIGNGLLNVAYSAREISSLMSKESFNLNYEIKW